MTDKLIEAMARGRFERQQEIVWEGGGSPAKWDHLSPSAQILERDSMKAALAAHAEWMKAEGKVVVPEVPTEAMLDAYRDASDGMPRATDDNAKRIFSAMISAAKGEA